MAEVRIGTVPVIGTVTLGGEPLDATLYFGGRSGAESIVIRSDEEGAFAGILPREGDWRLEVLSDDPKVHHAFRSFPVELDPGLGAAELDVELPDTSIAGRVLDGDGRPVEGAQVIVQPAFPDARIVQTVTGDDGSFDLSGQRDGRYHVKALGRAGTSSSIEILEVSAGVSPAPVDLVLVKNRTFRGRVVSDSGGSVIGAKIWAIRPIGSPKPSDFIIPTSFTDASGEFELSIPPDQPWRGVAVLAPGRVLGFFSMEAGAPDERTTLRLRSAGGATLTLGWSVADGIRGRPGRLLLDGQWVIDLGLLSQWAGRQVGVSAGDVPPAELRVPALPPGTYSYCTEGAIPVCDSGFLPAGGDLDLFISP